MSDENDSFQGVVVWPPTPGIPFEYSVYDHGPRPDLLVKMDGKEIERVTAFSVLEGWVEMHCTRDEPGHGTESHAHPDPRIKKACVVRYSGVVQLSISEGNEGSS